MIKAILDREKKDFEIEVKGTGEDILCELGMICTKTADLMTKETDLSTSEVLTHLGKILLCGATKFEEILNNEGVW